MESLYQCSTSGLSVYLIRGLGCERDEAEQEVIEAGVPLPIFHRRVWAANFGRMEPWFLVVRDAEGHICGGLAIEQAVTRAMPGHRILRLRRCGGNLPRDVFKVILEGLGVLVQGSPKILRVHAQVLSLGRCAEVCEVLAEHGFRELLPPTVYRHTLVMDLSPSEEEIFAKINESGRNKIRKTARKSGQSVVITDSAYADRIGELQQAALTRTSGHTDSEDWRAVLKISEQRPDLSQVFGLFIGEDKSPENMAAFGWVCNHGDSAEYRAAGSTRRTDVKIPFGYLVAWDMIRWAKANGAKWFDFGGVTLEEGDDPLKGISDFKRSFSREVAEVGAEWVYEPSPIKAKIAEAISKGAQRARHLLRK
jgi:hypothetical protein